MSVFKRKVNLAWRKFYTCMPPMCPLDCDF